jgi:uncharacterized protein YpmS
MDSGKAEISKSLSDGEVCKKRRLRKLAYWLLIDLSVAVLIIGLLVHRPGRYSPARPAPLRRGEVHPYLIELSSQFNNGTQYRKPFEIAIDQQKINEVVALGNWPIESQGILLYAPAVLFEPGVVVLMGTADIRGVELIVTIEIQPRINDKGLLNLHVATVKVGAMNITPIAKMIARTMYAERVAVMSVDMKDFRTKIAASLLNEEAFDPVFTAEDKKARLLNVTIVKGRLTARLAPAP